MKKKSKNFLKDMLSGVFIGVANGAFGAGGGMVAVPLLKKKGMKQKAAQENAVAVILPIACISAAVYIFKGYVSLKSGLIYIPTGVIGALLGTYIISKISPVFLKIVFGGFMVYAGVRLLFK